MSFQPISIGNKLFFHTAPTQLINNLVGESHLAHTHYSILMTQVNSLTVYCSQLSVLIENLHTTVNSMI